MRPTFNGPGSYDDAWFLQWEREDPAGAPLEYARHVLTRARSVAEDERTRIAVAAVSRTITTAPEILAMPGQCAKIAMVGVRLLESMGVWCFGVKGSMESIFSPQTRLDSAYFWTHDLKDFPGAMTGHMWIVAPPFHVVDLSIRLQRWQSREAEHLPDAVLDDVASVRSPVPHLFGSDRIRPRPRRIEDMGASYEQLWSVCPTRVVQIPSAKITYQPDGIQLPLEAIDDVKLPSLHGKRLRDVADDLLRA